MGELLGLDEGDATGIADMDGDPLGELLGFVVEVGKGDGQGEGLSVVGVMLMDGKEVGALVDSVFSM